MATVKIGLVQTILFWEDPEANFSHIDSIIEKMQADVDVIILPEMFSSGFTMTPENCPPNTGEESLHWMRNTAASMNAAVIGSTIWKADGNYFNRLFFVKPDGETIQYDKKHTFTLAGEDKIYQAGTERKQILFKGFNWCPLICYDLRFPVWSRNNSAYDVLIYVANWPSVRIDAWDCLLRARAIENLCYSVGLNRVGIDPNNNTYSGHSAVYDPLGNQLVHSKSDEVIYADLRKEHINETRNSLGFLEDQDPFILQ